MLLLTFQVDVNHYGIAAKSVVEVIPQVRARQLPGAPDFIRGVFNYRGAIVPIVDVTRMLSNRHTPERLSCRIILVRYPEGCGSGRILGLLTENSTGLVERADSTFANHGVKIPDMPFLGELSIDGSDMVQLVEVEHLLSTDMKNHLFQ